MFGYVVINEPDLRIREFRLYRSYYCGICMDLKGSYGESCRLTLSYDTVFLALLLASLYDESEGKDDQVKSLRCIAHPARRHQVRQNEFTRYAADIGVILSYYSCLDDWDDERDVKKKLFSAAIKKGFVKASERHPDKADLIRTKLGELRELENRSAAGEADADALTPAALMDRAGAIFGELMAEIFDYRHDMWSPALRNVGYYLGKYIYVLDAYDDLEKDIKSGSFNPLIKIKDREDFDLYVRGVLSMAASECSAAFETLPLVENIDIMRNILYAGIWCKFEETSRKRAERSASAPVEEKGPRK